MAYRLLCGHKHLATATVLASEHVPVNARHACAIALTLSPASEEDAPFSAFTSDGELPRLLDRTGGVGRFVFSEAQGWAMVDALDLFSRVHVGQLDAAYWALLGNDNSQEQIVGLKYLRTLLVNKVNCLVTGMHPNASWGISSPEISDRARIAFDLKQVVRHRLAWDANSEGGIAVSFDRPMRTSFEEDLAHIEGLNDW